MKKTLIALALTAGATFSAMAQDIVDTAVKAGNFKTLVAAVQAAGLVDTLKGPGPFTVFAPTDEAFAKIPKASLDGLLERLDRGEFDLVGVGRALLQDPEWAVKVRDGRTSELRSFERSAMAVLY